MLKADLHLEEKLRAATAVDKDDIEQIAGTAEDEFSESILVIRERELLYGSNSLLGKYASMIVHLVSQPIVFKVL